MVNINTYIGALATVFFASTATAATFDPVDGSGGSFGTIYYEEPTDTEYDDWEDASGGANAVEDVTTSAGFTLDAPGSTEAQVQQIVWDFGLAGYTDVVSFGLEIDDIADAFSYGVSLEVTITNQTDVFSFSTNPAGELATTKSLMSEIMENQSGFYGFVLGDDYGDFTIERLTWTSQNPFFGNVLGFGGNVGADLSVSSVQIGRTSLQTIPLPASIFLYVSGVLGMALFQRLVHSRST